MTTPWHPLTRIAFRFCFLYFGLFCLTFAQILFVYAGILGRWLPEDAIIWQMTVSEPLFTWVGHHVFGVDAVLHLDSGSGDQTVIWVMVFVLVVAATVGTLVWTVLDRRRAEYRRLYAWFAMFLRLSLAGQMLFYGVAKVIPSQMPSPPLAALLTPFGDLTPMSVLWLQVGSSHPYEMALGAVEVIAGLLLFWNRTATLGALVSAMAMAQVFLLNMTYDVPVKVLSSHLLLISLILVAPHVGRLSNILVLQRPSEPATQPDLFQSLRANRAATAVVALLCAWVSIGIAIEGWSAWREYGDGRPKPELYGIWEVTEFTADGVAVAPLVTDETRWQRVVFDEPGLITYQLMDGELVQAPTEEITVHFDRVSPARLRADGELGGKHVTMSLQQVDLDTLPLRNRGFNWVQDYPHFA
ncbi:DoxX family protein [Mycobacterium sp. 236(2023)]|uniref:DoxX family protein n=1 Tax=Mycobacterium sp. 236(2023) TaxID=3038163 RepID=UPI0024153AD9|nr:DoxX family protein [Mycobacterium sp. 236(2023)]MDG4663279.1 DoxX family protein [Mycobacterium sp. 236(2023)]